jgi:hypothetical protein
MKVKTMKFDQKAFELASARCFHAANKIDGVIAATAQVKNNWAMLAASGIALGELTIEAVEKQLINDYRLQVLKGEAQQEFDCDSATIGDCGSTIKGWFYDLKRVIAAGSEHINRVVNGESLTTVRRDTAPRQQQAESNPKKAPDMATLSHAISSLNYHIDNAMADNALAHSLAANAQLADLVVKIAKLEAKVSANLEQAMKAA